MNDLVTSPYSAGASTSDLGAERSLTTVLELFRLFGEDPPSHREVDARDVPEPQRSLLHHERHMTVALERFHSTKVELVVLAEVHSEPFYARRILLLDEAGKTVQFGIMRFDLRRVSHTVRHLILEGMQPLGRILIEHQVLRRISTHGLLRIDPTDALRTHISHGSDQEEPQQLFGRLATIVCNESPAVDLLEVVTGISD